MIEIEDDMKEPGTIIGKFRKALLSKRITRPSLVGVSKKLQSKRKKLKKIRKIWKINNYEINL